MEIKVVRFDGGLWVSPAPPYLLQYLRYSHRSMQQDYKYERVNSFETRHLYQTDGNGGILTLGGFYERIIDLVKRNLDKSVVDDQRTPMPPIDWDAVKAVGLRDYQVEPVVTLLTKGIDTGGIILATGGWGKTFAQMITYAAWNNLNTILAIPLQEVVTQTYTKFKKKFPDKHVGLMGAGGNDLSSDITIATFKSLPKCSLEKCQLLLIDEMQGSTGDKIQAVLSEIKPYRIFGYTATDDGLFNNADKVLKGMIGERLINIPYDQAQEVGAVVPCVVYIIDLPDQVCPSSDIESAIKLGIKTNKLRNGVIGQVCAAIPKTWQTIIFIDHIKDHLVELVKFMPQGVKWLHREASKKNAGVYALSAKQQKQTIEEFSSNQFQQLIATDAFRAGVDVPNCRVVVQGAGGSSKIEVLQEAFRGSRILTEETMKALDITEPKTHFVLIDFDDCHDPMLQTMAQKREAYYKAQGWTIRHVKSIEEIDWYYAGDGPKNIITMPLNLAKQLIEQTIIQKRDNGTDTLMLVELSVVGDVWMLSSTWGWKSKSEPMYKLLNTKRGVTEARFFYDGYVNYKLGHGYEVLRPEEYDATLRQYPWTKDKLETKKQVAEITVMQVTELPEKRRRIEI